MTAVDSLARCKLLFLIASLATAIALTACGGGSSSAASSVATTPASAASGPTAANAHAVYVDAGPVGSGYNANRLYTDVTICQSDGSSPCQTIPHVLVDTGSTGLRLLASVVNLTIRMQPVTSAGGQALLNCVRFVDGSFGWGPVVRATIRLGSKEAVGVPIQLLGSPASSGLSGACNSGGATEITAVTDLGANGIIGVGLFKEDCGTACVSSAAIGHYFRCGTAACTAALPVTVPLANQVKNLVPLFASDNNGVVLDLPPVGPTNRSRLDGLLIFGIGTQSNNQFGGSKVLPTDPLGYISATYEGRTLPNSFIDSGSNGLFVDSATLPPCIGVASFYCPATTTNQSVTLTGANGTQALVEFTVENAIASFVGSNPVLPHLVGDFGSARSFDLGLPFFYGRRVFFGIEGMTTVLGTGPYYAF